MDFHLHYYGGGACSWTPTNLQVGTRTTTTIALSVSPGSGGTPTNRWRLSTNNVMSNSDTVRNTTGSTVTFTGLNAGTSYWVDVRAENSGGNSGYNPSGNTGLMTSTLAAPPLLTAPSFTDDTGNAQTWTAGTAITSITVPAASGNPTPTYAANLPAGLAFTTSTRVIVERQRRPVRALLEFAPVTPRAVTTGRSAIRLRRRWPLLERQRTCKLAHERRPPLRYRLVQAAVAHRQGTDGDCRQTTSCPTGTP